MYTLLTELSQLNLWLSYTNEVFSAAPGTAHFDGAVVGTGEFARSVTTVLFDDVHFILESKFNTEEINRIFNMVSSEYVVMPMAELWKKTFKVNPLLVFCTTNNFGVCTNVGNREALYKRYGHIVYWETDYLETIRCIIQDKPNFQFVAKDEFFEKYNGDFNLDILYDYCRSKKKIPFSELAGRVLACLVTNIHTSILLDELCTEL